MTVTVVSWDVGSVGLEPELRRAASDVAIGAFAGESARASGGTGATATITGAGLLLGGLTGSLAARAEIGCGAAAAWARTMASFVAGSGFWVADRTGLP